MRRSTALLVGGWLVSAAIVVPLGKPASAVVGSPKVVVIVLENKQYSSIVGSASAPYMNSLIDQGLLFTDYHAVVSGSAPNYRAMTAGTTGPTTPLPQNIFRAFDLASRDWTELEESMAGACGVTNGQKVPGTSDPLYNSGHDPAYLYRGNESCATHDVPLTSEAQLSTRPEFTYLVPNQCDDMHTHARTAPCPSYFGPVGGSNFVEAGDIWLAHVVPVLLADPDTTVIITFDEGIASSAQQIFTLEVGAGVTAGTVDDQRYDHYGLLAGLYAFFGLGSAPNAAATATPLPIATDADPSLTVDVEGTGSVTSDPPGIACGSGQPGTCSATFTEGSSVTLTATPDVGSTFDGWSGDCTGTGDCVISMDAARSVSAIFGPVVTLTVDPPVHGFVKSDIGGIDCPATTCSRDFAVGTAVSLTPHAYPGFVFTGWGGDCDGIQTTVCTLTMDGAKSVSVTFDPVPQHTLTVATDGTAPGSVTSDVGGIDCPTACSADFADGQVVVLTAHAGVNAEFTGWAGACTGTSATCSVTVQVPTSATATFDTAPSVLTLDDDDLALTYDGWRGVVDAGANGGGYRVSDVVNDKATWKSANATSVTWIAHTGPDAGKASVTIDGKSKGIVDLYSPAPGTVSKAFGGLTRKVHTVIVKVASAKNAASTGRNVSIDAFSAGATFAHESDPSITYNTWTGTAAGQALGGAYRSSSTSSTTATVAFTGTAIDWITCKGPSFGKAAVTIDGISMGTIDLYKAAQSWQSAVTFAGLPAGAHTFVIRVLGQKAAASHGTKVLVDGFKIHA